MLARMNFSSTLAATSASTWRATRSLYRQSPDRVLEYLLGGSPTWGSRRPLTVAMSEYLRSTPVDRHRRATAGAIPASRA